MIKKFRKNHVLQEEILAQNTGFCFRKELKTKPFGQSRAQIMNFAANLLSGVYVSLAVLASNLIKYWIASNDGLFFVVLGFGPATDQHSIFETYGCWNSLCLCCG